MSEPDDFNYFADSVLVEVADRQTEQEVIPVNLTEACKHVSPEVAQTWIGSMSEWLRSHRFGEVNGDSEDPEIDWFIINSQGISRASSIRKPRKPLSVSDRLASDKVQKLNALIVSILSLLVSIGALILAVVALNKAN